MALYTVPSFLLQGLHASPSLCFQYSSPSLNLGDLTDPGGLPLDFPLSYQSITNSPIQGGLLVFPGGSDGKASVCNAGDWVWSLGQEDPWRRKWQPIPVLLPGKFHGQRSLVGYHRWGGRVRHDWTTLLTYFCYLLYIMSGTSSIWYLLHLQLIFIAFQPDGLKFTWRQGEQSLVDGYFSRA